MIFLKTEEEIELLRESNLLVCKTLAELAKVIQPGVTTAQLDKLAEEFNIDLDRYSIELVIALGKPKEIVKIVDLPESGSTAYYRDENGVHYVPKRSVKEIII